MSNDQFVLTLSCANRPGIVAAVSRDLFEAEGNIQEAHQFDDPETGNFFMRVVFNFSAGGSLEAFRTAFEITARRLGMTWEARARTDRQRVLLLVSRFDHCLADLLYRWRTGELAMDLAGIVSNYPRKTYAHLDFDGIPFHHSRSAPTRSRRRRRGSGRLCWTRKSISWSSPATCRCCPTALPPSSPAAASTSIIPSCPASRGRVLTTRPMRAA